MSRRFWVVLPPVCIAALIAALFVAAWLFQPERQPAPVTERVSEWRLDGETVALPLTVRPLPPRTPDRKSVV